MSWARPSLISFSCALHFLFCAVTASNLACAWYSGRGEKSLKISSYERQLEREQRPSLPRAFQQRPSLPRAFHWLS